jgi:hypothetical protein
MTRISLDNMSGICHFVTERVPALHAAASDRLEPVFADKYHKYRPGASTESIRLTQQHSSVSCAF